LEEIGMTNRRDWIGQASLLAASGFGTRGPRSWLDESNAERFTQASIRDDFPIAQRRVYLNNASIHPMSTSTRRVVEAYFDARNRGTMDEGASPDVPVDLPRVKALYAALIGARASDIAFVPSTTVGENLVVAGLGIPHSGGNVVTDGLHFDGSQYMYQSLKQRGLDVRVVPARDNAIHIEDMERMIDRNTKLVAVSFVSWANGFTHDLKKVADLAHANGALVYVDLIQGVGSRPVDVVAAGVDFAANASYKWLMGDLGVGFLYARQEHLGRLFQRAQYGFRQITNDQTHILPGDPPGDAPVTFTMKSGTGSYFEVGTWGTPVLAALSNSLAFLNEYGVARIHEHNRALALRILKELPRHGYLALTPESSVGSIVSFAVKDAEETARRLARAKVDVGFQGTRMRISPSIYNNDQDVDALLAALS
jgi:selenocysteine lyase/cysteine desulfurase